MHPNPENEKCCFHPQHMIIGVCAFCLNERLLILASQQSDGNNNSSSSSSFKLFAITAASLLNRFDNLRHNKKLTQEFYQYDSATSTSQEDSFISIKFEGSGGVGSWEKNTTKPKVSIEQYYHDNNYISKGGIEPLQDHHQVGVSVINTAVIEHSKMTRGPLRWQKRIGHHLFQLIRWKRRPSAAAVVVKSAANSHVPSNLEGSVKVRHGWIRSLTNKRRAKD